MCATFSFTPPNLLLLIIGVVSQAVLITGEEYPEGCTRDEPLEFGHCAGVSYRGKRARTIAFQLIYYRRCTDDNIIGS